MFTLHATLQHLAIISWAVPAARLAPLLPRPLVPNTIDVDGRIGLFSMATMLDTTLGETYAQLNERVYVTTANGGGEGAYFWKSHADTDQATLFHWLLGIPEFHDDVRVTVRAYEYEVRLEGRIVAHLNLGAKAAMPQRYVGKGIDLEKAWRISKNPMIGYTRNWGDLYETPVWHDAIVGEAVATKSVDPSFMTPATALDPGQAAEPLFAAYQEQTPFNIGLPPHPVGGCRQLLSRLLSA